MPETVGIFSGPFHIFLELMSSAYRQMPASSKIAKLLFRQSRLFENVSERSSWNVFSVHRYVGLAAIGVTQHDMRT